MTNEEILKMYDKAIDFAEGEYIPIANMSHYEEEMAYSLVLNTHLKLLGEDISIADLGCGIGIPLSLLPEELLEKINYTGYDLNPKMIEIAAERYKEYPNLRWQVYDIRSMSLEPADLIIANESLVYAEEPELFKLIKYYYKTASKCLTMSFIYRYPEEDLGLIRLDMPKFVGKIIQRYPGAVITRMPEDFLRISLHKKNIFNAFLRR